jgi:hypothetical protein
MVRIINSFLRIILKTLEKGPFSKLLGLRLKTGAVFGKGD